MLSSFSLELSTGMFWWERQSEDSNDTFYVLCFCMIKKRLRMRKQQCIPGLELDRFKLTAKYYDFACSVVCAVLCCVVVACMSLRTV